LYARAEQLQRAGDRIAAQRLYKRIAEASKGKSAGPYLALARRALAELSGMNTGDVHDVRHLTELLRRADQLHADEKTNQARRIWEGVVQDFDGAAVVAPHVEFARKRLEDLEEASGTQ
ncbi:MAG: hypothetical protein ACREJB_14130, partial [Planctomycetaceae bacterium]